MLDTDEHRDMYRRLWDLVGKDPPVPALYEYAPDMPLDTAACFYTHDGDVLDPRILIGRTPCPAQCTKPDLDRATLNELISLAHERGHERSWREGTYRENSMPEERRAWKHARDILGSMGFKDWDAFAAARESSLAEHGHRGTPE